MNQRYKTLEKFRKTKKTDDWNSYKTLRSRVRKEIRKAEANQWINCMSEVKDHKQFWKLYKDMTNMNKKPGIGALQVQDKVVHTDKEKAEALNEFFVSIGKDLEKNFSGKDTENDHSFINRVTSSFDRISLCLPNSGEARRKWMVVPITDLQTLKIYPKRQLDNCNFDRNGKVLLLENDHKMVVTEKWIRYIF